LRTRSRLKRGWVYVNDQALRFEYSCFIFLQRVNIARYSLCGGTACYPACRTLF